MKPVTKRNTVQDFKKLAEVSAYVPYHCPGNVIEYLCERFEIFQKDDKYKAVPLCCAADKRLTHLPPVLLFQIKKDIVYVHSEEHKDLVEDLVKELIKAKKIKIKVPLTVIHFAEYNIQQT
jgi:hypothetical protein